MVRLLLPCFLVSTLLVSGCINRTPPTPPLTQTQLSAALIDTETRLSDKMAMQCEKWEAQQTLQSDQLQQIEKSQRQLNEKLVLLDEKLDQRLKIATAATRTEKPVQCPPATTQVNNIGNKILVGQVEWLWIESVNRVYEARIDTGATTSSISALDITPFEKDGKRWVRFRLTPDDSDDSFEIEAPLVRYVRIRQASTDTLDRRPVAALTVKLGKMTEVAEFTLTDRTQMSYPILLGREFLRDVAVVDVAKKNIQVKPDISPGQTQPQAVSKSKKK